MNLRRLACKAFASLAAAAVLPMSAVAAPLDAPFAIEVSGNVGAARGAAAASLVGAPSAQTEMVKFAGTASVTGRVLLDPVFNGPPVLELVIDLTALTGVGSSTGLSYVSLGNTVIQRPLKAVDVVQITFPFYVDGDPGSARSGLATLNVTYSEAAGLNVSATLGATPF